MQRINIEKVISKLNKTVYWKNYINAFKKENSTEQDIEIFTSAKGVLEVSNSEEYTFPDWSWNKFSNLKRHFLELIFEEINYCPNCGKSPYLSTGKLNLKSFDLDHFFPKSKFKHLMFNFYNLIPICPFCNQKIKTDKNPFDYEGNIFHPYFGFFKKESSGEMIKVDKIGVNIFDETYSFFDNDDVNGKKRKLIYNSKHSKFFELEEIYLNSHDTCNVFNFIQDKITKIKDEQMNFNNTSKSIDELKNYFFNNYYPKDQNEILKYSNGKLKKDLIDNINLKT